MVAALILRAILVGAVIVMATEGGYFDDLATKTHMYDAKAAANNSGVAKQFGYSLRCRVGCDIKIFGVSAEQEVANGASDEIGLISTTA